MKWFCEGFFVINKDKTEELGYEVFDYYEFDDYYCHEDDNKYWEYIKKEEAIVFPDERIWGEYFLYTKEISDYFLTKKHKFSEFVLK